jgi:hypothetical protein
MYPTLDARINEQDILALATASQDLVLNSKLKKLSSLLWWSAFFAGDDGDLLQSVQSVLTSTYNMLGTEGQLALLHSQGAFLSAENYTAQAEQQRVIARGSDTNLCLGNGGVLLGAAGFMVGIGVLEDTRGTEPSNSYTSAYATALLSTGCALFTGSVLALCGLAWYEKLNQKLAPQMKDIAATVTQLRVPAMEQLETLVAPKPSWGTTVTIACSWMYQKVCCRSEPSFIDLEKARTDDLYDFESLPLLPTEPNKKAGKKGSRQ